MEQAKGPQYLFYCPYLKQVLSGVDTKIDSAVNAYPNTLSFVEFIKMEQFDGWRSMSVELSM
jgi:hypothetical protein